MTSYPVTMRLGLAVTSHFVPVATLYRRKVRRSHVKKSSWVIWENWLWTYCTSARKFRLNTSGCDSRWAVTSKFRLLTLPTLLPYTSVFSLSKPTTHFRHKQNHWLRSGSKRERRNQFSEMWLWKLRCPLRPTASMKQVYQHLPSKEADCNQSVTTDAAFPIHDHVLKKFQILCKDKVHISILCCSSDICAFTGRFWISIQ
jgi:hypothetical protein